MAFTSGSAPLQCLDTDFEKGSEPWQGLDNLGNRLREAHKEAFEECKVIE